MPWRVHNQKWFLYFLNRKQNLHRMQILCKSPDLHGVQDVKQIIIKSKKSAKNVEKYQNEYKIKDIGIKTAEDREGE